MSADPIYELLQFEPIVRFIDAPLSEINIGILIYHMEDASDPTRFA